MSGSSTYVVYPCGDSRHGCHIEATVLGGTIGLNQEQKNWLKKREDVIDTVNKYLENSGSTTENNNFAKAAVEAIMDGGEVDFDNEIIKDKSFVGTNADCVLKALMSANNNLFKKTSEAFTGDKSEYRIKFTASDKPNDRAPARTHLPDSNGIIQIEFNLAKINDTAMYLANFILHETIHAELHRIKFSYNAGPNPLPSAQFKWFVDLWKFFENADMGRTATAAEHTFMANYYINPIASGLREFDENTHPLDNYKDYAWTGLSDYGKLNGYITSTELSRLANLSKIVKNDTHTNPCD